MTTASPPFIRPLSLAELLDQAVSLYRRHFLTLVGIIAIPYIPLGLIQAFFSYLTTSTTLNISNSSDPTQLFTSTAYWGGLAGSIIVAILTFILVRGVATAAITRLVADSYTGQKVGILEAYNKLGSSWARLLVALLAFGLITIVAFIWLVIPCVGWFTGIGIFVFLVLVVSPLIAPVVVLERQGGFGAFRRAWDLGRSRFWWLLGFAFVIFLLGQLLVTAPVYLISLVMGMLLGNAQLDPQMLALINTTISTLMSIATSLLYLPLSITATTVVYFDLRVRFEGLDLALQAASETDPQANIVSLAETTPTGPQGSFITGTNVAYFLLLSLIVVLLYVILFFGLIGLMIPFMGGF